MNRFIQALALSLALGAMLLRAVLPAGWMPGPAGFGELVICTMRAPVPARHSNHAPLPDHGNQACPFAAAAHFAPPQRVAPAIVPALGSASSPIPAAPKHMEQ